METLATDSFQILLNKFTNIIENYPPIENVRKDLEELKECKSLVKRTGRLFLYKRIFGRNYKGCLCCWI